MKIQANDKLQSFSVPKGKIAIVAARFNDVVVDKLMDGAHKTLMENGVKPENIQVFRVPGAFEIPLVCQQVAETGRFAGIIALGVVIRGDTAHFDYVCEGCTQGLIQAQLKTQVPMMFGVLTTETPQQAYDRADGKDGNKGCDVALALLETLQVLESINAH